MIDFGAMIRVVELVIFDPKGARVREFNTESQRLDAYTECWQIAFVGL